MVTVIVDGRPVEVPAHTSASEIRRIARSEQSRPLARAGQGRNVVVSGELDVSEGDRFIVGRPFTKGLW
jgi:sulfate adenylyltransferase subunit 1 (EFTu-like GTPase family)